jgi:catechol 2,3-dioxygenase-like lactoylglutathione lyase family enzyme
MNVIDHLGLQVGDYSRALRFYRLALAPLGISVVMQVTKQETGSYEGAGFGRDGKPLFWIGAGQRTVPSVHLAFIADDRASVDRFFEAALAAGGVDNGGPGIRAHYHPNYYGAFVLDPEGHNIDEAVCHKPE